MGFAVAVLGVLSSISITTFHMTNYHAQNLHVSGFQILWELAQAKVFAD